MNKYKLLERLIIVFVLIVFFLLLTRTTVLFENSRITRAKVRLNNMRKLAYAYFLRNGSLQEMQNCDVWEDNLCNGATYFRYWVRPKDTPGQADLIATRCTSNGLPPNASRAYNLYLSCDFNTDDADMHCNYDDNGQGCFGLKP